MTVQPRERSVSIAASPVDDGAEPPDWSNFLVPVVMPEVTRETRMPSMLVSSNAVSSNADSKSPPWMMSKALAGKLSNASHLYHAAKKLTPLEKSSSGKLVSDEHRFQVLIKLVPLEVFINGKLVNEVQLRHA